MFVSHHTLKWTRTCRSHGRHPHAHTAHFLLNRHTVGQTQERVHARFRTADGVAGRARAQKSGEPADAHGLEGRGPGMQTGRRRPASGAGSGPVRWAAFHRRGRDQLQEGPHVHDRGRRPRPGTRHLDASGSRTEGVRPVLPSAHARPARVDPGGRRRRGRGGSTSACSAGAPWPSASSTVSASSPGPPTRSTRTMRLVSWYNSKRLHASLGYRTPEQAENEHYRTQAAQAVS